MEKPFAGIFSKISIKIQDRCSSSEKAPLKTWRFSDDLQQATSRPSFGIFFPRQLWPSCPPAVGQRLLGRQASHPIPWERPVMHVLKNTQFSHYLSSIVTASPPPLSDIFFWRSTRYYTIFGFLIRLSHDINDILLLIIGAKFVKK